MAGTRLTAHLEVHWGDGGPTIEIHLEDFQTRLRVTHPPESGMRNLLLRLARPLLIELERLPEEQPKLAEVPDDDPF